MRVSRFWRATICFLFVLFAVLHTPLIESYVGVAPAYYSIDFQPGLVKVFSFDFNTNQESELEVYLEGDLKEYAELSTTHLKGGGRVNVLLKLPQNIEKPGLHKLFIGAKQLTKEEKGTIGVSANVRAVIKVYVPYPGKYAELDFSAKSANAGEPIEFRLKIFSRGKESINTLSRIEIYDFEDKKVGELNLGETLVEAGSFKEIVKKWNTEGYSPGKYTAVAVVRYGSDDSQTATAKREFRIGELYIDIVNYTKVLEREKINKFEIVVESFWNGVIDNVFANVTIPEYNIQFITPSSTLEPFEKKTLKGYFDTTPIDKEQFKAKIEVHYKGKVTEKEALLKFKRKIDYKIVVGAIILALSVLTSIILIIILYRREHEKKR